jgi:hypothetical protein
MSRKTILHPVYIEANDVKSWNNRHILQMNLEKLGAH